MSLRYIAHTVVECHPYSLRPELCLCNMPKNSVPANQGWSPDQRGLFPVVVHPCTDASPNWKVLWRGLGLIHLHLQGPLKHSPEQVLR